MRLHGFRVSYLQDRNRICSSIAICSLLSSGFGYLFSAILGSSYLLLMRMSACQPVSIVGSLVAVIIPYFVSILVVTNLKPALAQILCGARIFHFTVAYASIDRVFGSAGWLFGFMLLFPDVMLVPFLLFSVIRKYDGGYSKGNRIAAFLYVTFIGIINYCIVSPFLSEIIRRYETNG